MSEMERKKTGRTPVGPAARAGKKVKKVNQVRERDPFAMIKAETRSLSALCKRKLAALEALKKSLLHQAFTGEL